MFTTTAKAPANIALVKYWGKADASLNIPANNSLSFNLSNAFTKTTVTFSEKFKSDQVIFAGKPATDNFAQKSVAQLQRIRGVLGSKLFAKVETENSFPTGSGIASSASGMAALTMAAVAALGKEMTEQELSALARKGSGSACRSIPDGFVEWYQGDSDQSSYAASLYPADYWQLHDLVVIVKNGEKSTPSSAGHATADTSPFFTERQQNIQQTLKKTKQALKEKDFTLLGKTAEKEALNMHAVMMTSTPPLVYWSPDTLAVMKLVEDLRGQGVECYFTIDAGANVHVLVEEENVSKVASTFSSQTYVKQVIDNTPTAGAKIIKNSVS